MKLLACIKMNIDEIIFSHTGGGSGTKCRTSRRLSVVLDIFH